MRWYQTKPADKRIRTRFLWFPKTINRETRWLERASWKEEYFLSYAGGSWEPIRWLPEAPYLSPSTYPVA